jgi:hypothetical protein
MPDLATALQKAINTTKENNMQTQTTELKKTINDWSKDESKPKHLFGISNNVSRSTFNLVKANPGCDTKTIVKIGENQGHKATSVTSLLAQLTRVGQIRKNERGQMWVTQPEYTPIKVKELKAAKAKADKEKQAAERAARKALREAHKAKPVNIQPTPPAKPQAAPILPDNIDQLLSTLSFTQAIALYKKLKTMLGEV